jgi:sterol 24-C-methyltransferase
MAQDRNRPALDAAVHEYEHLYADAAAHTHDAGLAAKLYYDFVTDFYRFAWGDSFHFAARKRGESFRASLKRSERGLADRMDLKPGMAVLDVGCGVGGPLCAIAAHSGASITGITNNAYLVAKGNRKIAELGIAARCRIVLADFMAVPAADASFDAAYAIEATAHTADKVRVFSEILRVLKPGGVFGGYEWCLIDRYDARDPDHRRLKSALEVGASLPDIATTGAVVEALKTAGFQVLESRDGAGDSDPETPWYRSLQGRDMTLGSLPRTPLGRSVANLVTRAGEAARLFPAGTREVSDLLNAAADNLVEAGVRGIFSPLFFFLARKPAE